MSVKSRCLAVAALIAVGGSSATAAQSKTRACVKTSSAGQTFKVKVVLTGAEKQSPYSCGTARGVVRAYHKSSPSVSDPTATVRYRGKKWDCYVIRDSSGYNCWSSSSKVDRGTITGLFA